MRNILLCIMAMLLLLASVLFTALILDMNRKGSLQLTEAFISEKGPVKSDEEIPDTHDDSTFNSHLPLVLIETGWRTITEEDIWTTVTLIDNENGRNYLTDKPNFQTEVTIKLRGTSSITFDKKQYRIEFYKEREGSKKNSISVMGMVKDSDWVLNGPFLDRSLIRNSLIYGISREIMEWAPDTRYCEVFINGVYKGVYLMVESVKVSESRIHLKDYGLINGETAYMIQREIAGSENNTINSFGTFAGKTFHELSVRYPSEEKLTERQKEWIRSDVSEFERVLYSNQFNDLKNGYPKYIDVDSFVDYYVINEFVMNKDAGYMSTTIYKDLGGKFKLTVWDFNNAFDNYTNISIDSNEFVVNKNNWYERLFKDRTFTEKVVNRYHELRKGVLSDDNLFKIIDEKVLYLGDAVDRNFGVWGYTFSNRLLIRDKQGIIRDPKNYEEAIIMLKKEITDRGKFLDENIEQLYQYVSG